MSEFAKLYGSGDDQVLILMQEAADDGKPEVRTFFQPPDLGLCSIAVSFEDSDHGWDAAEKMFSKVTEEWARGCIKKTLKELGMSDGTCDEDCAGCPKEKEGMLLQCDHSN